MVNSWIAYVQTIGKLCLGEFPEFPRSKNRLFQELQTVEQQVSGRSQRISTTSFVKYIFTMIGFRQNLISVQYSKIKNITNSNELKRDTERLAYGLLLPPLALAYLWKKNHIYTIIEYDDGYDIQKIVLDFEKGASYAQSIIYRKMLECRKTIESKKPDSDTSSHSPMRF